MRRTICSAGGIRFTCRGPDPRSGLPIESGCDASRRDVAQAMGA